MELLSLMLSDSVGILSLITIVVAALVVIVCGTIFVRKSHNNAPSATPNLNDTKQS
jgi:uncharacterized protein YneF (UPF0154 family)